jgi:HEPN domain-containing protein
MLPCELAMKFLELAARDRNALRVLAADKTIADETVGFHAQQAVEKCLKSILILHGVAFRKTHALDELIDILNDNALPVPPNVDELEMLTPYAVLLRYDFLVSESLSRKETIVRVKLAYEWAERLIAKKGTE